MSFRTDKLHSNAEIFDRLSQARNIIDEKINNAHQELPKSMKTFGVFQAIVCLFSMAIFLNRLKDEDYDYFHLGPPILLLGGLSLFSVATYINSDKPKSWFYRRPFEEHLASEAMHLIDADAKEASLTTPKELKLLGIGAPMVCLGGLYGSWHINNPLIALFFLYLFAHSTCMVITSITTPASEAENLLETQITKTRETQNVLVKYMIFRDEHRLVSRNAASRYEKDFKIDKESIDELYRQDCLKLK